MSSPLHVPHRRLFLRSAGAAALLPFWTVRGLYADELTRTPPQTEGPFYPNKLPLDTDNDLIVINDNLTPSVGEITHLTGKILDVNRGANETGAAAAQVLAAARDLARNAEALGVQVDEFLAGVKAA